jgi:hypothetical protein
LQVFDVLGREIATLVNEEKLPEIYEVRFDASSLYSARSGLASGTYFYRRTSGGNTEIKKMILIK